MLRATLTISSPFVVLEQEESALGVGQLDDRVHDQLEQARQAQLAVETLVDPEQAAQPAFAPLRAGPGFTRAPGARTTLSARTPFLEAGQLGQLGEDTGIGILLQAGAVVRGRGHEDLLEQSAGHGQAPERIIGASETVK